MPFVVPLQKNTMSEKGKERSRKSDLKQAIALEKEHIEALKEHQFNNKRQDKIDELNNLINESHQNYISSRGDKKYISLMEKYQKELNDVYNSNYGLKEEKEKIIKPKKEIKEKIIK